MIKKILKALGYTLLMLFFITLFLPKKSLWYTMEEMIAPYHLIIDQEQLSNGLGSLTVKQGVLYYQNLELARIKKMTLSAWLLFQKLTIHDLYIGKDLKLLQGIRVKELTLSQQLFTPMRLSIQAEGNFGSLNGSIDFSARTIALLIKAKPPLKAKGLVMRQLKPSKEGYRYERHF